MICSEPLIHSKASDGNMVYRERDIEGDGWCGWARKPKATGERISHVCEQKIPF